MGTKRQHFFPRALIRNFLPKGAERLWVYDRIANSYRFLRPEEIAIETHLYSVNDPNLADQRFVIEEALANLEGKVTPLFMKLQAGGAPQNQTEWYLLSEYMGLQTVRTPEVVDLIRGTLARASQFAMEESLKKRIELSPEGFKQELDEIEHITGNKVADITQDDLRRVLRSKRLKVKPNQDQPLALMIEAGTNIGINYSSRQWAVLHAPSKTSFIGSDTPVMPYIGELHNILSETPIVSPNETTFFPFSRSAALVIGRRMGGSVTHLSATKADIKALNAELASTSRRIIFGDSERLLKSLANKLQLHAWHSNTVYDEEGIRNAIKDKLAT